MCRSISTQAVLGGRPSGVKHRVRLLSIYLHMLDCQQEVRPGCLDVHVYLTGYHCRCDVSAFEIGIYRLNRRLCIEKVFETTNFRSHIHLALLVPADAPDDVAWCSVYKTSGHFQIGSKHRSAAVYTFLKD